MPLRLGSTQMKVIVFSPGPSSFVLRDVDLLREMGHTVNHVVASKPRDLLPLTLKANAVVSLRDPSDKNN